MDCEFNDQLHMIFMPSLTQTRFVVLLIGSPLAALQCSWVTTWCLGFDASSALWLVPRLRLNTRHWQMYQLRLLGLCPFCASSGWMLRTLHGSGVTILARRTCVPIRSFMLDEACGD